MKLILFLEINNEIILLFNWLYNYGKMTKAT